MDDLVAVGPGHATNPLLEREVELGTIEAALADARRGVGQLIVVEGEAGIGKSSLLHHAADTASASGMAVAVARGSELEQNYPFSIVIDLFGPLLREDSSRTRLLGGAARLATWVLEPSAAQYERDGPHDPFATLHGLFWLTVNASEQRPLVLVVDDAHWADDASLRYLHYLAQRLEQVSVAVIVGQRRGEGAARSAPGKLLAGHAAASHISPARLSERAIRRIMTAARGREADEAAARQCWQATNGNPFFATELLRSDRVPAVAGAPGATPATVPDTVARSILVRVERAGPDARRVAEAIAVLDDEATLELAATLARVEPLTVEEIVRQLVDAAILEADGGLSFVHPITRNAIYGAMPGAIRAASHREAAELLRARSAPTELVAAHLLVTDPAGDAEVVGILCEAAHAAMAQAAPEVARTYLRRALAEPPPQGERSGVLVELARADAAIGTELTVQRFTEALDEIEDPIERARVMLELGHAHINAVEWEAATEAFQRGLDELGNRDRALASRLEAGFVSAAFVSRTHGDAAERVLGRVLGTDLIDPGHRELATWAAFQRAAAVTATADEMSNLVERAIGDVPTDELVRLGQLVEVAAGVFVSTDHLDREIELLSGALDAVQRLGLQAKFGIYSYCRAWPLYYMGRLTESVADAQAALGAHELGWEIFYPATVSVLALAYLERGEIGEAERMMEIDPERWSQRLDYQLLVPLVRGRVALARGRFEDAAREFELARDGSVATGVHTPVPPDWRTWLAITLTRLGRRDDARRVAREGIELAERWAARWPLGVAYRAGGVAEGGAEGLALLRRAVDLLATGPARLEHARAMIVLGEALRRSGATVEARETLARGVDLAHSIGATSLMERARGELIAAGARPRRYAVRGIEALTPSELRVARLAAEGRTNREVAQALFVTPKAVEYHLGNAYRKLGIGSRAELPSAIDRAVEVASV